MGEYGKTSGAVTVNMDDILEQQSSSEASLELGSLSCN